MTRPFNTLMWMVAFVCTAAVAITFVLNPIIFAFNTNPWFNALILLVLIIGILHNFQQVTKLFKEISWIERFRASKDTGATEVVTPLLAPMARMLSKKIAIALRFQHYRYVHCWIASVIA